MQTLNFVSLQKRLLDDDELVVMVLEQYVRDLPRQLEKLRTAYAAEDMKEVARLAHKIKGSSGNIGAELLQEMAAAVEHAALQDDWTGVDKQFAAMNSHYPELKAEADTFLRGPFSAWPCR